VLNICTNGTNAENQCLNEGQVLNISATLSIYTRQASTINARSNYSILSVNEIGPPSQVTDTDIATLRQAIKWLLDYTAAGIPPDSAFITIFWDDRLQLANFQWSKDLIVAFQSMIVVPMWFFSVSNYGNVQVQKSPTSMLPNLPPEFTTTASLARPHSKIAINSSMFYTYIGLELGALLISWTVILVIILKRKASPVVSGYPLIDFAAKTALSNVPQDADGIENNLRDLTSADNVRIRSRLSKTTMYLRVNKDTGGGDERSVVLVTTGRSTALENLSQGMLCR